MDETPDGDIVVYGKCTDATLDADRQIVDSGWSGQALDQWLKTGGNVRVQHSPFLYPAGNGLALDIDRDGDGAHWLKALVVEDTAKKLVKKGVLRDFSIGVLDPRVVSDFKAPQGRICGGSIGEVSLVDRGSNKNSAFTIAKAVRGGPARLVCKMTGMTPLAAGPGVPSKVTVKARKKITDSSGKDRSDVPAGDFAGPGHTFPIETRADVPDAASLAHHAADPAGVRDRIGSIADRKWPDMDLPPTIDKETVSKADSTDDSGDGGDTKTCMRCKAKSPGSAKRCVKCNKKLGMLIKSDAAQDYPGDKGDDDETTEDYNAEGADDSGDDGDGDDDSKEGKQDKQAPRTQAEYLRALRKAARRGKKRGRDPSAVAGGAKGKQSDPAPGPPVGSNEGSDISSVLKASGPSFTLKRMHDAVCPMVKAGKLRRDYSIKSVDEAIPMRELQALAIGAIEAGNAPAASYYLDLVRTGETIKSIGPEVLIDARKAYPELFPTAHPAQTSDIHPSQFSRGYMGDGRPDLSAEPRGSAHPDALVHHVSASDFQRGFMGDGRASVSPGEGRQATFDSAVMGQAATAMRRMHDHMAHAWPELCSLNVSPRDYSQGDGSTGITSPNLPTLPTSPGESGRTLGGFRKNAQEEKLRRKLAKSQVRLAEQDAEIARLGAMPDPERSAYRGIPELDGPVDRSSYIDKAASAGGEGPDDEFRQFVEQFAEGSGDPTMRANAQKVLRTLITK
jgi:hypothetical protein